MTDQSRSLKSLLYLVQHGECFYCSRRMVSESAWQNPRAATLDHLVPKNKGGRDASNIVLACRKCNSRRCSDDLSDDQWQKAANIIAALRAELNLRRLRWNGWNINFERCAPAQPLRAYRGVSNEDASDDQPGQSP